MNKKRLFKLFVTVVIQVVIVALNFVASKFGE